MREESSGRFLFAFFAEKLSTYPWGGYHLPILCTDTSRFTVAAAVTNLHITKKWNLKDTNLNSIKEMVRSVAGFKAPDSHTHIKLKSVMES